MPELVLSDASCPFALSIISKLEVLHVLYGRALLTPTVADEFGMDLTSWIDVEAPEGPVKFDALLRLVDRGEASAIALAINARDVCCFWTMRKPESMPKRKGCGSRGPLVCC